MKTSGSLKLRRLMLACLVAGALLPGRPTTAQEGRAYQATPLSCLNLTGDSRACFPDLRGGDARHVGGINNRGDSVLQGPEGPVQNGDPMPLFEEDRVLAINDYGFVVGARNRDSFAIEGTRINGLADLPELPHDFVIDSPVGPLAADFAGSEAVANNRVRTAVGTTRFAYRQAQVFGGLSIVRSYPTRWTRSGGQFVVTRLQTSPEPASDPFPGAPKEGSARDVNDAGLVAGTEDGQACLYVGTSRAVLIKDKAAAVPASGFLREASGVANLGQVTGNGRFSVGSEAFPPFIQDRGFIWAGKSTHAIVVTRIPRSPIFKGSRAHKINSGGFAVGAIVEQEGGLRAALWDATGNVAALVANVDLDGLAGWMQANQVLSLKFTEAVDINDAGQILILGEAQVDGRGFQEMHAFLLTPTGAPIQFLRTTSTY
jgi:hypothetical protein